MWLRQALVLPLLGPVEGGTRLTVLGSHFRESSSLACRFGVGENGGFSVAARFLSSSQLECVSPVVAGASARSVEVSFNGQQFSMPAGFALYAPTALASASPTPLYTGNGEAAPATAPTAAPAAARSAARAAPTMLMQVRDKLEALEVGPELLDSLANELTDHILVGNIKSLVTRSHKELGEFRGG
ncbi:MAG: IPT/TIG domain-containing protein, partial [Candidatus Latescibacterota bacterium]|nr:IPT/TIG domain-containing protein [Candidatus Latescibacterota bacterium]